MSALVMPSPVLARLEGVGHRADDGHLEAVEDPHGAQPDDDQPVPARPRAAGPAGPGCRW